LEGAVLVVVARRLVNRARLLVRYVSLTDAEKFWVLMYDVDDEYCTEEKGGCY
jgi:hypothetical protein